MSYPNAQNERRAVIQWLDGELSPNVARSVTFLGDRAKKPSGQGRIIWDAYVGLYRNEPYCRTYGRERLSAVDRLVLKRDILAVDVAQFEGYTRSQVDAGLLAMYGRVSRTLPIGVYTTGSFTAASGAKIQEVAALWVYPLIPPGYVMARLQKGLKEQVR